MINQGRSTSLSWVTNALVPPACPVCLKPVVGDDGLCAACWRDIQFISGPVCRRTGLPMPIDLGEETISPLARLIYSRLPHMLPRHALLLPVPLHRRRLLWRRFNQSAELCRHLAKLSGQSLALEAVARIRPTPQQIGLTRAGRKRNLRGAFAVPEREKPKLKGRAVVIVDDVLTTGATVEAMARILRRAGAAPINVVTAARVVLPERF